MDLYLSDITKTSRLGTIAGTAAPESLHADDFDGRIDFLDFADCPADGHSWAASFRTSFFFAPPGGFAMGRFVIVCGLLLFTTFEVGCCNSCKSTPNCSGCGELYLGDYVNDPPRAEPCDRCGNYTGCDPCDECSRYPWNRSRARIFQSINDFVKQRDADCCNGNCGGDCDKGCGAAATCAEPACGDVGCGSGIPSQGGDVYYEEGGAPLSSRSPSRMQNVSRPRVVQTAATSRSPQNCNCGNH